MVRVAVRVVRVTRGSWRGLTLVLLVAKIICESQINTDAVKKKEAFLMVFFRDEGLRYVSTTKSLLEHRERLF